MKLSTLCVCSHYRCVHFENNKRRVIFIARHAHLHSCFAELEFPEIVPDWAAVFWRKHKPSYCYLPFRDLAALLFR